MSFESFVDGMPEKKSTYKDNGNSMSFDPDKRMDVGENQLSPQKSETKFDSDKRMDINENLVSNLETETKYDPDKRTYIYIYRRK